MELILKVFSGFLSIFITVAGIVVLIAMIGNYIKIANEKDNIEKLLKRRNRRYNSNHDTGELEEVDDTDAAVTPDTIRAAEKTFNFVCSKHNAIAQLIPVFPLMGVFGTVWGLMKQANHDNIENMLSSLDIALGTTILGLSFAIIMKIFDALCSSRAISDTEVLLDDFDKKMELKED